jgi:hypothetical protein
VFVKSLVFSLMVTAAAQGAVAPVSLSQPPYPSIALSARIAGEVDVVVYLSRAVADVSVFLALRFTFARAGLPQVPLHPANA